ncbi:MAG: polysaccharide deacetylase family protein [Bdellovibrio sp.]|nr:polysaccharide deacetylase family protein [Bdellovibrio sp.]
MNYDIRVPHGVMFHHFHGGTHPTGQGSISQADFEKMLLFIGIDNIVGAADWFEKYPLRQLENKVCITFDDSLKCQYDLAKPVLDKYNIKAFFFVYTSVLTGAVEYLEVFRYFRSVAFKNFDDFFGAFIERLQKSEFSEAVNLALTHFNPDAYLEKFSFYTKNDKIFRYLRDHVLKVKNYNQIMLDLIQAHGYSIDDIKKNLWMSANEVKQLKDEGHFIGLHSDTHPTTLGLLEKEMQKQEYTQNKSSLEEIIGSSILTMSHPCNSYDTNTLDILKKLKIQMGFRANMESGFDSVFEIPREDHINVYKKMRGE